MKVQNWDLAVIRKTKAERLVSPEADLTLVGNVADLGRKFASCHTTVPSYCASR